MEKKRLNKPVRPWGQRLVPQNSKFVLSLCKNKNPGTHNAGVQKDGRPMSPTRDLPLKRVCVGSPLLLV